MTDSGNDGASKAAPGWYPVPGGGQQYWDGERWLDIPMPPMAAATATDSTDDDDDETWDGDTSDPGYQAVLAEERQKAAADARRGYIVIAVLVVLVLVGVFWFNGRNKSTAGAPSTGSNTQLAAAATTCGVAANLKDGGTTLTLDTKGNDDATGDDIVDVACVLTAIKTPQSVIADIDATRALDGRQEATWDGFAASWRYHPDSGVQMIITEQ